MKAYAPRAWLFRMARNRAGSGRRVCSSAMSSRFLKSEAIGAQRVYSVAGRRTIRAIGAFLNADGCWRFGWRRSFACRSDVDANKGDRREVNGRDHRSFCPGCHACLRRRCRLRGGQDSERRGASANGRDLVSDQHSGDTARPGQRHPDCGAGRSGRGSSPAAGGDVARRRRMVRRPLRYGTCSRSCGLRGGLGQSRRRHVQ